tara:strand:- start:2420 stop:2641 length:222 start_codon:yes stop_codon:yes gene_type:complete
MPADVTEQMPPEQLLGDFKSRYDGLIKQNQELQRQIKQNETQALKLLGAIETLEYLQPPQEEPPEGDSPEGTE